MKKQIIVLIFKAQEILQGLTKVIFNLIYRSGKYIVN